MKISKIEKIKTISNRYDIEVEDNHNFFANEILVHNSSLYKDYFHARSLDGNNHWTQNWLKRFHAGFSFDIPQGWRICGENLFALHSIGYENLDTYFFCFSIWTDKNVCLSVDETLEYCDLFGIQYVPILYRGIYDEGKIKAISLDITKQEGYVIRKSRSFDYGEFSKCVAKFVRKNHVQNTVHNWKCGKIEQNKLRGMK